MKYICPWSFNRTNTRFCREYVLLWSCLDSDKRGLTQILPTYLNKKLAVWAPANDVVESWTISWYNTVFLVMTKMHRVKNTKFWYVEKQPPWRIHTSKNKNFSNLQRPRRLVMGTQLCMHFVLYIHPWRSAACTPFIFPFFPICLPFSLRAEKRRPSFFLKHI